MYQFVKGFMMVSALRPNMKGQASWMWFMFGATQLLLGSKVSPELEILGMFLNANGSGFLLIALFFLFKRDKIDALNPQNRKAERTTLIRGEDGNMYEVPIATKDSKFTLVLNIIWFLMMLGGWIFV
jgi:hypothetical protein|tara:strand:+ start:136 stop:516 length:381 start_codon:yes stop_codon:yes gene_type:complete